MHTLWQRKKREKERKLTVKIQQAAANNINNICSSTCFFFKEPADKKKQKNYYNVPLHLAYVSHQGRFEQPRTNWRRGRLQKATTARDRCVVHMCASSVLSRRATSPAPAQRKKLPLFLNLPIQMGPRKSKSRIFGDPQTGEVSY